MKTSKTLVAALAVAALFAIAVPLSTSGAGTVPAADKAAVSGSTVELLDASEPTTALTATVKTSAPTDLFFSLTAECALWTTVATVGNEVSEASASIRAWIEVDGEPVPVGGDDDVMDGQIVLCDRLHRQTVTDLDDEDARIEQFLRTRQANGFNWGLLDVGAGTHTIEVKVEFVTFSTDGADARAAIGHRTLIVEPTKLAHGAEIQF